MSHTVLVVPVPELEDFVRDRTQHYDPSFVSADPAFVHAHITALGPFLDDPSDSDLEAVGRIAATTPAVAFKLATLGEFPDGTIHLLPEPSEPFARLTRRLTSAFPHCPPYDGRYPDLVPHVTLDRRSDTVSPDSVRAALSNTVPARCRADRIGLHRYANHDCVVLAEWKLCAP